MPEARLAEIPWLLVDGVLISPFPTRKGGPTPEETAAVQAMQRRLVGSRVGVWIIPPGWAVNAAGDRDRRAGSKGAATGHRATADGVMVACLMRSEHRLQRRVQPLYTNCSRRAATWATAPRFRSSPSQ